MLMWFVWNLFVVMKSPICHKAVHSCRKWSEPVFLAKRMKQVIANLSKPIDFQQAIYAHSPASAILEAMLISAAVHRSTIQDFKT